MNISNAKGIHAYYANRILNITRNISVIPIVWQDVWDEKVQVWFYFHITRADQKFCENQIKI